MGVFIDIWSMGTSNSQTDRQTKRVQEQESSALLRAVLGIRDILVRIWIRGSAPLTNGSETLENLSSYTYSFMFFTSLWAIEAHNEVL